VRKKFFVLGRLEQQGQKKIIHGTGLDMPIAQQTNQ
jgi:hypothetical protein